MNDLSATAADAGRRCRFLGPIPAAVPCVLVPLLLAGLGVAVLILVAVRNAVFLVCLLLLFTVFCSFLVWNSAAQRRNLALLSFVDRFPCCDLRTAKDGQLVKLTGRFIADFYITDAKSGIRALVKSGEKFKVGSLIEESVLINTTSVNRELSPTLKKWLRERHLSSEPRLLRLEEGYVKEGSRLTVMGMLIKKNRELLIVPPPETISTGCLLRKFLLPIDVEGIVLKVSGTTTSTTDLEIP